MREGAFDLPEKPLNDPYLIDRVQAGIAGMNCRSSS